MVSSQDTPDDATARTLTRPEVQAAAVIQRWQGENQEVNALARELAAQVTAVNSGDLKRAEGMLTAQAHTLDEIFNSLARRAYANISGGYVDAADRYLRLALKAQSQCRATLETLATLKNPPVLFARQANITAGHQQVNNGIPAPSGGREIESEQSKLLEVQNGQRLDTRTASAAVALIRKWRPWEKSTGPRTSQGKRRVSRNAYKGGLRQPLREVRRVLNQQRVFSIRVS